MNRLLIAGLISLVMSTAGATQALAASVDHAAAVNASAAPCTPSHSKIGGDAATTFCGPATATLKVSGKTYKFKGGYCKEFDGSLTHPGHLGRRQRDPEHDRQQEEALLQDGPRSG